MAKEIYTGTLKKINLGEQSIESYAQDKCKQLGIVSPDKGCNWLRTLQKATNFEKYFLIHEVLWEMQQYLVCDSNNDITFFPIDTETLSFIAKSNGGIIEVATELEETGSDFLDSQYD